MEIGLPPPAGQATGFIPYYDAERFLRTLNE